MTHLSSPPYPGASLPLVKVRQSFPRPVVADVDGAVRSAISASGLLLPKGARVALGVGSRGIAGLPKIVGATVRAIRALGGEPFIVPAMGSHGGGTADGQVEVLTGLGVTEASVGCAIRSSMEVVEIPGAEVAGGPVFMDRLAYEADGVVLINRIKPHTDFHARYESGLVKMAAIGLGKARQALEIHRHGVRGLTELMPRAAEAVLACGKILLGIAVVENAYDEAMVIEAVAPGYLLDREPELLRMARANMPRLPVESLDLLIIDRVGKDISGVGMDPNIIGRIRIPGQPEPESPAIAMIVVSDLTDASHGNATGVGLADVTTRRLFEKVDLATTNINVVTSAFLERGKLPLIADTDRQAAEWALRACGPIPPGSQRVVRIRDTLHLDELYASAAVIGEISARDDVAVIGEPTPCFGPDGDLVEF